MIGFLGEIAALSAAGLWAIATVGYQRAGQVISPLPLNLSKGVVAIVLLLGTLGLQAKPLSLTDPQALVLLLISGIVGIGVGDTFLFQAINSLGTRRTLLLSAISPSLSALLGLMALGEVLTVRNWMGIGLTIAGIVWVIAERTEPRSTDCKAPTPGILYGLLAALGQAVGAVLSRAALAETAVDPLWSSLLRLVAGEVVLVLWWLLRPHSKPPAPQKKETKRLTLLGAIGFSAFCGTYLGIWLQQIAIKHTAVGIAQALSSTSPLFVLPIVAGLGESVSLRAVVGVLIAIAGIVLLFGV